MLACTSHAPPDGAEAQDPAPADVTAAPEGWAVRVDAGGDEVVGLVVLTDGGTAVLTYENGDTSRDAAYTLNLYDAVGELWLANSLGDSYRGCRRCLAAVPGGGVAVLDSQDSHIQIHAADGGIEVLEVRPAEPGAFGIALRSHPLGGFVIGSMGERKDLFVGRIGAGAPDKRGRPSASWTSLGGERPWGGMARLIDVAIAADGTFAAAISCGPRIGGRCQSGGVVGQWDPSGALEWLRPVGSSDAKGNERLSLVAIAPHPEDGFFLFSQTPGLGDESFRMVSKVDYYGHDGSTISTKRLPIDGAVRDAAVAGQIAWLAVLEPAPRHRRLGSIVRVDLDTGEHVSLALHPHSPTDELRRVDVMTPTMIATEGDQVRIAGFYGWPTRVPLVDHPAVDLDLRDPNGVDDEVFLWALAPGAVIEADL